MTPPPDPSAPIERHFDYLNSHAKEYANLLNQEGLWLLLAMIACMGVPNIYLRLIGAILAIFLFSYRFVSSLLDKNSFSKMVDRVKTKIEMEFEEGIVKENSLSKLHEIERNSFGNKQVFGRSMPFLFCAVYSVASLGWIIVSALDPCARLIR